jgi:hypothetical protein
MNLPGERGREGMETVGGEPAEPAQRSIGNVTVDPLAPATPVENPEIVEVLNLEDGSIVRAADFIAGQRYQDLVAARVHVSERLNSDPIFACAWCGTPAYIVATGEKRFFFRHKVEDGSCPAQTRGVLTREEIQARKYHGLRESGAHRRLKALIERSLAADPAFHAIRQETVWRSARDPKARRQPDVQAICHTDRFAFEVQLSTTFLDVVAGRRNFYRDEGALLIWVLGHFTHDYRRLTTDDLLFSNNSNIFVVDNETTLCSEAEAKFHLRCHYRCPIRAGDHVGDTWQEQIVAFDELTFEQATQRAYYFDYDQSERALHAQIEREKEERQRQADDELRQSFFAFWRGMGPHFDHKPESFAVWRSLCSQLEGRGVRLPETPDGNSNFRALLNALLSAEVGNPVGWGFKNLIEVAHHLYQQYPNHLLAFGYALEQSGRKATLERQDASGKWKQRRDALRSGLRQRAPEFMPDPVLLAAQSFLFPAIGERVAAFMRETDKRVDE